MNFPYEDHLKPDELDVFTVQQESLVTSKGGIVTCGKAGCDKWLHPSGLFRCYYCGIYFCAECMGEHLGETREDWHTKKNNSK